MAHEFSAEEIKALFDAARPVVVEMPPPVPMPLTYSFEMKQAAKGQKYYDIKVMNVTAENFEAALKLYDTLDVELSSRALLGE